MNNCFVSTPIYYVNSDPHIGHAYTNVISECIVNWEKLKQNKTFFLTGTDEHGQKVETSAKNADKSPIEFVDYYAGIFKELADSLNIQYDDFIRTTEDRHAKAVQECWKILKNNGFIYLGHYKGWYSVRDEAFYDESEIIDGKAPTGAPVEWREEESYFFKLSAFQDKLLNFYKENPDFIMPHSRANEVINFVEGGLKDLSVSRTNFTWGIKVPDDERHVVYVWIDALINYISALGFPDCSVERYKDFWENSKKIHVIGKDILRFHAVYWPAMLMACDLPLPSSLVAHGWWLNDGQKISKSLGNVIDPSELMKKFGCEYFKYFMLTETGINNDGNFKESRFIEKINNELVNNFGNLVSRTTNMIVQYFFGIVNKPKNDDEEILKLKDLCDDCIEKYKKAMDEYKFNVAAQDLMAFSSEINKFIDEKKPWVLGKSADEKDRKILNDVLYTALDMVRVLTVLMIPFIKDSATKILNDLSIQTYSLVFDSEPECYKIEKKINIFNRLTNE
jgi:methionyl-tRNA synthetase